MQIDWFTLVAQLFNFLVLVWLLKRFLYKPILDAIDAREQGIAQALQEAAVTQQEASTERDKLAASNAALDAQSAALLEQARAAAATERQQLMQQAHAEAEALTQKRRQDQQQELQQLHAEIYRLTLSEVFALARKLLSDLANSTLEQSLVEAFIAQLQTMAEDSRKELIQALTSGQAGGLIRSAFALDEDLRKRLQDSINNWAGAQVPLKFESSDELICGLELSAKGRRSTWNISTYLEELQASLSKQLAAPDNSDSAEHGNV